MTYKTFVKVMAFAALILAMTSCKYPEGPVLSIATATDRVAQEWEVFSATDSAGNDISDQFDDSAFKFEDDKDAEATLEFLGIPLEYEGTWDLDQNQTVFELDLAQKVTTIPFRKKYDILRLTRTEFWLQDQEDQKVLKLELD